MINRAAQFIVDETPESAFGGWQVPGHPVVIEYAFAVLDQVRSQAVEGLRAVPRGGLEIGGVLYGRREGNTVRIEAHRPLDCEHALGPTFLLSAKDEVALGALVAAPLSDADLQGMVAVGWYHSHTRSEICLTPQDVDVYDRHFPEPWQLALVLRPQKSGPTRAGFFFREGEAGLRTESSYREFTVSPAPGFPAKPQGIPPKIAPGTAAVAEGRAARLRRPLPAQQSQVPVEPSIPDEPPRRSGRLWKWAPAVGLLLTLAGLGTGVTTYFLARKSPVGQGTPNFALRAVDVNGQLLITWDRGSRPIAEAQRGILEIGDGPRRTLVDLDRERVSNGSVTYVRQSDRVDVRMTLYAANGKPMEEVASFLGRPTEAVEPPAPSKAAKTDATEANTQRDAAIRDRDEALQEAAKLRTELQNQISRNNQLEEAVRALRHRLEVQASIRRR